MEQATTIHEQHHGNTKEIWRTFWILLILTLVELVLGYWMIGIESPGQRLAIKVTIIILMLAKAFYIVAYFMHLKAEVKNLVMTIIIPLIFLVWGIVAFLYEGNSFRHNRNTYDRYQSEKHMQAPSKHEEEKTEEKKPGSME